MIKLFRTFKNKLFARTQSKIFEAESKTKQTVEPYIYPWHYDSK